MDPRRYPNPRAFDPTWYMQDSACSAESAQNPDVSQRDRFAFGAGRRICVGMHVVDRSMFLVIARLMWAFDISKVDWVDIIPNRNDFIGGILVRPRPFPVKITPRSKSRAAT